jgi:hypothetical protein
MLIILAAVFLNFALRPNWRYKAVDRSCVGMVANIVFYVVLGCFMETLSIMLTTTQLLFPIVQCSATIQSGSGSC